ncbi:hypothetical protein KDX38_02695 [Pseudomonas sp. CDFA 602]|uniref:hypothetical protein n=1 Tax=Pseudomonas californiensis TaxID=2829823 RepID=UPI001E630B50|nr:hypothetical protein [Pseudomonas californiensis]MCD5992594.1 hypothetical protein [Pseudomonas californiensis]MCD5998128.1 hypothetical protein [Pseudomonas californiensis]
MSTQGTLSRARLLPTILGAFLLALGVVMLLGGFRLVVLGGSFYYMLSGFGFLAIGVLLVMGMRFAVWLFTLMLLLCTVWALWEVGLDRPQLMPRLFIWFLVGLVLLLPVTRKGLKPLRRRVSVTGLVIALILAGVTIDPISQLRLFAHHYRGFMSVLAPGMADLRRSPVADRDVAVQVPEG